MRLSLNKKERLKSKKLIDELFAGGQSIKAFPLKFVFKEIEAEHTEQSPILFGVTVGKRLFKRAVDRNLLKRRMREAYRVNQQSINEYLRSKESHLSIMTIYTSKDIEDYAKIEAAMLKLISRLKGLV